MQLYTFWRSSAAYRVRIALALKGLDYASLPLPLRQGAQRAPAYLALNPHGLVPTLVDGERVLTQSLAIIEYLEETRPEPPLLPAEPYARARVRAIALAIACDIHPLNNLRVLTYLQQVLGQQQAAVDGWYRHWIEAGFEALEASLADCAGDYCYGSMVTVADICLVPQVYNARRFSVDMSRYSAIDRIDAALRALPAFARAAPECQPDAE